MAQLVYLCFRDNVLNESFTDLVNMKYDHQIRISKPHFNFKEFEKISQLIELCNSLKDKYNKDNGRISPELFQLALEQLRVLNRIYENKTNWMIPVLYQSSEQLYAAAKILDRYDDENADLNQSKEESYLIQAGRIIHMTLNICFKDRNENARENKKNGVFHFGTILFKIYYQIKAFGLLNNMGKVFESRLTEIKPYLDNLGDDLVAIKFNYYMGLYYGYEKNNYELGHKWLQVSFEKCAQYEGYPQTYPVRRRVLLYLIPMKILYLRQYPRLAELRALYPDLFGLYKPLIESLCNGQLSRFEAFVQNNETFLVTRNLYVSTLCMRELVHLKLVHTVWNLNGGSTKLALDRLRVAFMLSRDSEVSHPGPRDSDLLDEIECILATLISKNYVRGYLSHSHRVMMTSKAPFPKLVQRS